MKKIMKSNPLISIVMPVYNGTDYLAHAVESILNQTYKNIKFIIIDDASTDDSYSILKRYAKKYPKKITLLKNCHNHNSANAVSKAIAKAKGEFLARMDADDISLPNRLEKQLLYLQKHTKTVAVGTQCLLIDKQNAIIGEKTFPTNFAAIYKYIYSFCPIQQPTLMIATKRLPKNFSYYHHHTPVAEDLELLFSLFRHGEVENLPDYLHMYRLHDNNTSLQNMRQTFLITLQARIRGITDYGYRPTPKGVAMSILQFIPVLILPQRVTSWLYKVTRNMYPMHFTIRDSLSLEISKVL